MLLSLICVSAPGNAQRRTWAIGKLVSVQAVGANKLRAVCGHVGSTSAHRGCGYGQQNKPLSRQSRSQRRD